MIDGWDQVNQRYTDIKLLNMDARIGSLEKAFIEYAHLNPKGDDQWTEARLRALEDKIKLFEAPYMVSMPDREFDPKTGKLKSLMQNVLPDMEYLQNVHQKTMLTILQDRIESNLQFTGKLCLRLDQIEKWFNEAKQTHDADLKRVGSDFERIFKRIEALEARQNPNSYNKDAI